MIAGELNADEARDYFVSIAREQLRNHPDLSGFKEALWDPSDWKSAYDSLKRIEQTHFKPLNKYKDLGDQAADVNRMRLKLVTSRITFLRAALIAATETVDLAKRNFDAIMSEHKSGKTFVPRLPKGFPTEFIEDNFRDKQAEFNLRLDLKEALLSSQDLRQKLATSDQRNSN